MQPTRKARIGGLLVVAGLLWWAPLGITGCGSDVPTGASTTEEEEQALEDEMEATEQYYAENEEFSRDAGGSSMFDE